MARKKLRKSTVRNVQLQLEKHSTQLLNACIKKIHKKSTCQPGIVTSEGLERLQSKPAEKSAKRAKKPKKVVLGIEAARAKRTEAIGVCKHLKIGGNSFKREHAKGFGQVNKEKSKVCSPKGENKVAIGSKIIRGCVSLGKKARLVKKNTSKAGECLEHNKAGGDSNANKGKNHVSVEDNVGELKVLPPNSENTVTVKSHQSKRITLRNKESRAKRPKKTKKKCPKQNEREIGSAEVSKVPKNNLKTVSFSAAKDELIPALKPQENVSKCDLKAQNRKWVPFDLKISSTESTSKTKGGESPEERSRRVDAADKMNKQKNYLKSANIEEMIYPAPNLPRNAEIKELQFPDRRCCMITEFNSEQYGSPSRNISAGIRNDIVKEAATAANAAKIYNELRNKKNVAPRTDGAAATLASIIPRCDFETRHPVPENLFTNCCKGPKQLESHKSNSADSSNDRDDMLEPETSSIECYSRSKFIKNIRQLEQYYHALLPGIIFHPVGMKVKRLYEHVSTASGMLRYVECDESLFDDAAKLVRKLHVMSLKQKPK